MVESGTEAQPIIPKAKPPLEPRIFLSEFPSPVQRLLARRGWSLWLSGILLAGVGLILIAGHLAKANVIALSFDPDLKLAGGQICNGQDLRFEYGYAVELSHGFFFIILAPLFIILSEVFLHYIDEAINQLLKAPRRIIVSKPPDAKEDLNVKHEIAVWNRQVFRHLIWSLPAAFIIYAAYSEGITYKENSEKPTDLGYIQAPFIDKWATNFNTLIVSQQLQMLPDPVKSGLKTNLLAALNTLSRSSVNDISNWWPSISLPGIKNPQPSNYVANLNPSEQWSHLSLNLSNAAATRSFTLQAQVEKGPHSPSGVHLIFVISVVVVEGLFHGYLAWVLFKIGFWISLVYRWLPTEENQPIKFNIRFNDDECKYGLGELYTPYNFITALLLIGGLGCALNYLSNSDKHTSVLSGADIGLYWGQIIILIAVCTIMGTIVFGPMAIFQFRLHALKKHHVKTLEDKKAACGDNAESIEKVEKEIRVANKQWTWPIKDKTFRRLGILAFLFIFLPVLLKLPVVPAQVEKACNALAYVQKGVTAIANWFDALVD